MTKPIQSAWRLDLRDPCQQAAAAQVGIGALLCALALLPPTESLSTYLVVRLGIFLMVLGVVLARYSSNQARAAGIAAIGAIPHIVIMVVALDHILSPYVRLDTVDGSRRLFVLSFLSLCAFVLHARVVITPIQQRGASLTAAGAGATEPSGESKGDFGADTRAGAIATVVTGTLTIALVAFSVFVLRSYSGSLFMLLPFTMGWTAATIRAWSAPITVREATASALSATVFVMVGLLLAMLEGVACLLTALPLVLVLSVLGAVAGFFTQRFLPQRKTLLCALILANPLAMISEESLNREPPSLTIVTEQRVDARADAVWRVLSQPSRLGIADGWMGSIGFTVPNDIALTVGPDGKGELVVTTPMGPLALTVLAYEPGRKLSFAPKGPVVPMQETSPYATVYAPHLDGYFKVERGTIELIPDGDETIVRAESVVRHNIWPAAYWYVWTGKIFELFHRQVIEALRDGAKEPNS